MIEATTNTAVGFAISWACWVLIIDPLFGFHSGAGQSFLITCIFTIVSLLRQYILRRLFNGRSPGAALASTVAKTVRRKTAHETKKVLEN